MLGGINAVGIKQDEPMQRAPFAELLVRELAHDARKTAGWLCGPENRCQETMLDRAFPWPLLRLAFREVPPGSGVEELQLGHRGAVLLVEVGAPPGDARLQAVPVGDGRMLRCVGGYVVGSLCHEDPPSALVSWR